MKNIFKYQINGNQITFFNRNLPYDVFYCVLPASYSRFNLYHLLEHYLIHSIKIQFLPFAEIDGYTNKSAMVIKILPVSDQEKIVDDITKILECDKIDSNILSNEIALLNEEYKCALRYSYECLDLRQYVIKSLKEIIKKEKIFKFTNKIDSKSIYPVYTNLLFDLCKGHHYFQYCDDYCIINHDSKGHIEDLILKEYLFALNENIKVKVTKSQKIYLMDEALKEKLNKLIITEKNFVNLYQINNYEEIDRFVKECLTYDLPNHELLLEKRGEENDRIIK